MNIQIFGTAKSFDTKKAERYFKDRRISFQSINLKEKEMSRGEFESVCKAVGGAENLIDKNSKDYASIAYLQSEDIAEKLLECQTLLNLPIVRNGKLATTGYCPDVWKTWE
jgi:arsenate reductase